MFASDPGTAAAADLGTAAAAAAAAAADSAEAEAGGTQTRGNALDTTQLDPRKAKRILANRQSAQRSRMKRLQYINELEGRKDKAEAGVRELRSKVVKAQRQQTGLAQQVEEKKEEVSCYADSSVRSAAWVPAGAFSCRLLRCWIVVRDSYEADRRCARSSKGLRGGHTRTRRGYFAHA
jgi:hypothetical protein